MKRNLSGILRVLVVGCARLVLRRHRPIIVGITGSVGKTTTTTIIGGALAHEAVRPHVGSVWYTPNNMNGTSGLMLVVLGYRRLPRTTRDLLRLIASVPLRTVRLLLKQRYPRVLVLEYGLSATTSVRFLASIAPPRVAIITAIGPGHLERYGTVEGVMAEKGALVEAVLPDGLTLLGADNAYAASLDRLSRAPVRLIAGRGREFAVAAAREVGAFLGVPAEAIEQALATPVRTRGRQDLVVCGPIRVLDDTFNANPLSMAYGLELLAQQARPNERRVAILGGMGELASESARYHGDIAAVARQQADVVIGVGDLAREYGFDQWYASTDACIAALPAILRSGDFVFLKGSASVKLVRVAAAVRAFGSTMAEADVV